MALFALDTPAVNETAIGRLTRFSGWYLRDDGRPADLRLRMNGRTVAGLRHLLTRMDVGAAHPGIPGSGMAGFAGDLLVPADVADGAKVRVAVVDHGGPEPVLLAEREYTVAGAAPVPPTRERRFDILDLVRCPETLGRLRIHRAEGKAVSPAGHSYPLHAGVPHFTAPGGAPAVVRLTQEGETHEYGFHTRQVIDSVDGLVLDFGAGNPPREQIRPNVVCLEFDHFRMSDVVSHTDRLPFADGTFAAVVSQAVFEHIRDPFRTAREFHRVLRPGGLVYVETAFMQPFHGDPCHFYNMTVPGLERVMEPFVKVETGTRIHQRPSQGWIMQIDHTLPWMAEGAWKKRLAELLHLLRSDSDGFDESLGERGRMILAAGVYFLGRKAA